VLPAKRASIQTLRQPLRVHLVLLDPNRLQIEVSAWPVLLQSIRTLAVHSRAHSALPETSHQLLAPAALLAEPAYTVISQLDTSVRLAYPGHNQLLIAAAAPYAHLVSFPTHPLRIHAPIAILAANRFLIDHNVSVVLPPNTPIPAAASLAPVVHQVLSPSRRRQDVRNAVLVSTAMRPLRLCVQHVLLGHNL
jgi:hypothetical protein